MRSLNSLSVMLQVLNLRCLGVCVFLGVRSLNLRESVF